MAAERAAGRAVTQGGLPEKVGLFRRLRKDDSGTGGRLRRSEVLSPRSLLVFSTVVLVIYGVLMTFSVTSVTETSSSVAGGLLAQAVEVLSTLKTELASIALGTVLCLGIMRLNVERILSTRLMALLWTVVMALLAYTLASGSSAYGATRWISIAGFSLQPSEFAKGMLVLLVTLAVYEFQDRREAHAGRRGAGPLYQDRRLWVALGATVLMLGAIFLQRDLGTIVIIFAAIYCMLFITKIPKRYLLAGLAVALVVMLVALLSKGYRMSRVEAWLGDVINDPSLSSDEGYQIKHGLYALGTGGFFGTGLGSSRLKYGYLTQADNDFIFAILGEELGLLFGTLPVIAAFCLFGWAGFKIASTSPDRRGQLLATGMTSLILIQALINIGGVIKLIPETGRTLPFVSSGGSSMIACLAMVGFILSVSDKDTWATNERRAKQARRGFGVLLGGGTGAAGPGGQVALRAPGSGEVGGREGARRGAGGRGRADSAGRRPRQGTAGGRAGGPRAGGRDR